MKVEIFGEAIDLAFFWFNVKIIIPKLVPHKLEVL
jgi:hypothetical protein